MLRSMRVNMKTCSDRQRDWEEEEEAEVEEVFIQISGSSSR